MNWFTFILGLTFMIGVFLTLTIRLTHPAFKGKPLISRRKVHRPEPKINMPEPGICQCSDALCFHKLGGECSIEGCPCEMFVPSDAKNTMLEELGNGAVARMALEAAKYEIQWRETQNQLETSRNYR